MTDIETRLLALEGKVETLADRDAIRELTATYCRAIASGDVPAVVELFCEDAVFETDPIPTLHRPAGCLNGRDEILAAYTATLAQITPKPFLHNHLVEVDGDRAQGFCSVEIRVVQGETAYNVAGHYEDAYRRVDGLWKFERRRFVVYYWTPATEGWA